MQGDGFLEARTSSWNRFKMNQTILRISCLFFISQRMHATRQSFCCTEDDTFCVDCPRLAFSCCEWYIEIPKRNYIIPTAIETTIRMTFMFMWMHLGLTIMKQGSQQREFWNMLDHTWLIGLWSVSPLSLIVLLNLSMWLPTRLQGWLYVSDHYFVTENEQRMETIIHENNNAYIVLARGEGRFLTSKKFVCDFTTWMKTFFLVKYC